MNFFKPLPQPSPVLSDPQTSILEPISSPPSSPPLPSRAETKRRPRLLRFKGNSLPRLDTHSESDSDETPGTQQAKASQAAEDGTPTEKLAPGLKSGRTRSKASPTVQTTLNISMQAAFSECKVCDTVWNPLYPDDVKYHQKQHAAVLRRKKRLEESEL